MNAEEWTEQHLLPALDRIEGVDLVDPVLGAGEAWLVSMQDGSIYKLTIECIDQGER